MSLAHTPHEIAEAFSMLTRTPTQADIDVLTVKEKIALAALTSDPGGRRSCVGLAKIERQPDNRFDFSERDDDAETALIVIGRNGFGDAVDLVAFRRDGYLAPWLGPTALLGEENVLAPRFGEPLTIHKTAFDWLRADREGIVLIDEKRAARELRDAGPFLAADVDHGLHLKRLFAAFVPKIVVPTPKIERSAA